MNVIPNKKECHLCFKTQSNTVKLLNITISPALVARIMQKLAELVAPSVQLILLRVVTL